MFYETLVFFLRMLVVITNLFFKNLKTIGFFDSRKHNITESRISDKNKNYIVIFY